MTYCVGCTYPLLRDTRSIGLRLREEVIKFPLIRERAEVIPDGDVVTYDGDERRGFGLVQRNAACVKGRLEDLVGFDGKIRKRHRLKILTVVPIQFLDIEDRAAFVDVGQFEFPYHFFERKNFLA